MKRYCIKCRAGKIEFFDIINESDTEFKIRRTQLSDGKESVTEESISRHLFNMCLNTGYIFEIENDVAVATVA